MKGMVLQPIIADESIIVQTTQSVIIDKSTQINVLNGFRAVVFIDEKVSFRIDAGAAKKIYEYDKDYLNKQCKIAFVRTKLLPQMMWGFGNIQVNNERLKEAYRVGANGKYSVEIVDIAKLLNGFNSERITIDDVRGRTVGILRTIGSKVLGKYFAKTDISVFEIAAQTGNIRNEMLNELSSEKIFDEIGLKLNDLTVEKIHVPEEDLELIKNRINGTKKQNSDFNEEISQLRQDLTDMRTLSEQTGKDSLANLKAELDRIRAEISQSLYEQMKKQLDEFGDSISSEIEDMLIDCLPLREEAKDENIERINLTARKLIERADEDTYAILAANLIYHEVEKNLISKYNLAHKNEKFCLPYEEFLQYIEDAKVGNRYFLKVRLPDGSLKPISPRVIETASDGTPLVIEMHPIIRFMKVGLNPGEAKKATDMWMVLNKIRHDSKENNKRLAEFFKNNEARKEYLRKVLDFYQEKGLYVEE